MNAMLVALAYSCTEGAPKLVAVGFCPGELHRIRRLHLRRWNCSDQIAYNLQFDGLGLDSSSADFFYLKRLALLRLALLHLQRPYGPFPSGHLDFAAPHQRSVLAL